MQIFSTATNIFDGWITFTYINILFLAFLTFKLVRVSLEELGLGLLFAVAHGLVIFLLRLVVISLHSSVAAHSGQ